MARSSLVTPSATSAMSMAPTSAQTKVRPDLTARSAPSATAWDRATGPLNVQTFEQFGAKEVPSDPVRDQELLDRTKDFVAQVERDMRFTAEQLGVQERRLAEANEQFAATGSAEDRGWVKVWQENVQQARMSYEGMQLSVFETRALCAPAIASLERSLERSRAAARDGSTS